MAEITTECQDCGAVLTIQQSALDAVVNCPSCGNILAIDPSLLPPIDAPRKAVPPPLPGESTVQVIGGKRVRLKPNGGRGRPLTGVPRSTSGSRRSLPDVQENYGRGTMAIEEVPGNSVIGIVIGSINVLFGVIGLFRIVAVFVLFSSFGSQGGIGMGVLLGVLGGGCLGIGAYTVSGIGLILQKRWGWISTMILAVIVFCLGVITLIARTFMGGGSFGLGLISLVTNVLYPMVVLVLLNLKRVRIAYAKT